MSVANIIKKCISYRHNVFERPQCCEQN